MPETKKVDRRVRRSRAGLREALLELLLEQDYEGITIQEIAERADLNRATFYLHYGSKEELLIAALEARFDELVAQIESGMQTPPNPEDKRDYILVFEHVAAYAALYKTLLGDKGRAYVINRIIDYITEFGLEGCRDFCPDEEAWPAPPELISRHMAGALHAMLSWWVLNDMPYSAEYMATLTHRLSLEGVMPIFNALAA